MKIQMCLDLVRRLASFSAPRLSARLVIAGRAGEACARDDAEPQDGAAAQAVGGPGRADGPGRVPGGRHPGQVQVRLHARGTARRAPVLRLRVRAAKRSRGPVRHRGRELRVRVPPRGRRRRHAAPRLRGRRPGGAVLRVCVVRGLHGRAPARRRGAIGGGACAGRQRAGDAGGWKNARAGVSRLEGTRRQRQRRPRAPVRAALASQRLEGRVVSVVERRQRRVRLRLLRRPRAQERGVVRRRQAVAVVFQASRLRERRRKRNRRRRRRRA